MALRPHSVETPLEKVLGALRAHGEQPKLNGSGYVSRCPAHEDSTPSLSISEGKDGACIFHCHAECPPDRILDELDLTWEDLFPARQEQQRDEPMRQVAEYDYVDEAGTPLFQVVRFEPKTFRQRRLDSHGRWVWGLGDTRRVLYHLDQVNETAEDGGTVYIVEGEKDADALAALGHTATCNPMGAGKWDDEYAQALKGASVIVVADRDDTGRAHARVVARSLEMLGIPTQLLEPAAGKDTTDHLAEGLTLDELVPIADETTSESVASTSRIPVETWSEFRDHSPETIDYLVDGLIPAGALVFVASQPKAGKTWLALALAISVATGNDYLSRFKIPNATPVLYLALEGHRTAIRTRIGCIARGLGVSPEAGALDLLNIAYQPVGIDLANDEWAADLIATVASSEARIVFVDVLRHAAPKLREDGKGSEDFAVIRANLAPLMAAGITVVLVHHFVKSNESNKGRSIGEMMTGSGSLFGAADLIIGITSKEWSNMRVDFMGRNEATPEPFRVKPEGSSNGPFGGYSYTDTVALRTLADDQGADRSPRTWLLTEPIAEWIREQGRRVQTAELVKEFNVAKSTIADHDVDLEAVGIVHVIDYSDKRRSGYEPA